MINTTFYHTNKSDLHPIWFLIKIQEFTKQNLVGYDLTHLTNDIFLFNRNDFFGTEYERFVSLVDIFTWDFQIIVVIKVSVVYLRGVTWPIGSSIFPVINESMLRYGMIFFLQSIFVLWHDSWYWAPLFVTPC